MAQCNPQYKFTPTWDNGSTDNTIRNKFSAHNGTRLSVQDADHPILKVVSRGSVPEEYFGDNWIEYGITSFLFDHVSKTHAVKDLKQYLIRPDVMSAYLDKLMGNGLSEIIDDCLNVGDLIRFMINIASKNGVGYLTLSARDIIELEEPNTGTWFDELRNGSMTLSDRSGRAYAHMRGFTGFWTTPADLGRILPVINQMPYSAQSVVGDIQNLPDIHKAQMMGGAIANITPDPGLVRVGALGDCMMDMYAGFNGDAYRRAFETNWSTFYTTLAVLGHASKDAKHPELRASPAEAATAVLAVARVMGITETKLTQPLAEAVVQKLDGSVTLITSDSELDDKPMLARMMAAFRASERGVHGHGSSATGGSTTEEKGSGNTDSDWIQAAKNADVASLIEQLAPLDTTPVDNSKVIKVLLTHPSAAGMILINANKVPKIPVLRNMSTALIPTQWNAALNDTVNYDRSKTPQPSWGSTLPVECTTALIKGKWCTFTILTENHVKCDPKTSINFVADICHPLEQKEMGKEAADITFPS